MRFTTFTTCVVLLTVELIVVEKSQISRANYCSKRLRLQYIPTLKIRVYLQQYSPFIYPCTYSFHISGHTDDKR